MSGTFEIWRRTIKDAHILATELETKEQTPDMIRAIKMLNLLATMSELEVATWQNKLKDLNERINSRCKNT